MPLPKRSAAIVLRLVRLPIGSIKTNLGHLETAAGVAGLLKAMLVVKKGQIPPSLHFRNPNPHIDFEKLKLRVPTTLEPFPRRNGRAHRRRQLFRIRRRKRARNCRSPSAAPPEEAFQPFQASGHGR